MSKNIAPNSPLDFPCGKSMKNRFMLAALTNLQSHSDGSLSDEEFHWLTMRAKGQFGLVMTCATFIHPLGKAWEGQLGIHSDAMLLGHRRLAQNIRKHGSLALVQLHHGGMRCKKEILGAQPVCPSDHEESDSRGLSLEEVFQLREDFIQAAQRAKEAGYDGVEIHGAHGYILCQFISKEYNRREDQYGGSLENRTRIIFEIIDGIRRSCGPEFLLGIRLSPERFGMELPEIKALSQWIIDGGKVDFLDLSLWDVFKVSKDAGMSLMEYFGDLDRKGVRITVAGKIRGGEEVHKVLDSEVDFVSVGRAGILHHDFPAKVIAEPHFQPVSTPVSEAYLQKEGLSSKFIEYMKNWKGFVAE